MKIGTENAGLESSGFSKAFSVFGANGNSHQENESKKNSLGHSSCVNAMLLGGSCAEMKTNRG